MEVQMTRVSMILTTKSNKFKIHSESHHLVIQDSVGTLFQYHRTWDMMLKLLFFCLLWTFPAIHTHKTLCSNHLRFAI